MQTFCKIQQPDSAVCFSNDTLNTLRIDVGGQNATINVHQYFILNQQVNVRFRRLTQVVKSSHSKDEEALNTSL